MSNPNTLDEKPISTFPFWLILIPLIMVLFLLIRGCDDINQQSNELAVQEINKAAEKAAAEKAAAEKAAAEKAAAEKAAAEKAAAEKAAAEKAAAEKAAAEKAAAEKAAAEKAAAEKAAAEKAAAEKAAAEKAAAEKAAAEKAAAEKAATTTNAESKIQGAATVSDQPIIGFTHSDERAAQLAQEMENLKTTNQNVAPATDPSAQQTAIKGEQMLNAFGQTMGDFFGYRLQSGKVINIPKGGFEETLANALGSETGTEGKHYVLDRIYFESGSSTLNEESDSQIDSIASIMIAYPRLNFMLRGHTDNTGSEELNKQLSKARAQSVLDALAAKGVAANRLATDGMGPVEPIDTNDTEEGKRKNRRIDISVQ